MKRIALILGMMLLCLIAGCKGQADDVVNPESTILIYEVNIDHTKLGTRNYEKAEGVGDILIERVIDELSAPPQSAEYRAAISSEVTLNSYQVTDGTICLDFDENYHKQSKSAEVLSRAAIVKTLTQIDGVEYVRFTIGGAPLSLTTGTVVGNMIATQFVDDSEDAIGSKEQVNLTLYYADENGTSLVKVNRKVEYSSNVPLDRIVLEQLIEGVSEETDPEEAYPSINPDTKIVSSIISDGTCYVNFNSAFLSQIYENSAEVTIYSIVNSLVELPEINRVQISINGNSELSFMETMSLDVSYERNLELVKGN